MSNTIRVLTIGDIVGERAVDYITGRLRRFRDENKIDLTVANGENAAPGNGLDRASAEALLVGGVDVITGGNHIWQKKDLRTMLEDSSSLIRPANYPPSAPGNGYTFINAAGYTFLVMNVMGTVFLDPLDCPFRTIENILKRESGRYDFAVLDIHAEATAEKLALAHCFDGRISVIFGTHTHVPTADEQVLPGGSGYITDIGMTGPYDSVLGVKKEIIIEKFRSRLPARFETAEGDITVCGAIFDIDTASGHATAVTRIKF